VGFIAPVALAVTVMSLVFTDAAGASTGSASGTGNVCYRAHVQDIGWQGTRCGTSVSVGTTGRSLRMEAIWITVP
jgi:hypothetical protein